MQFSDIFTKRQKKGPDGKNHTNLAPGLFNSERMHDIHPAQNAFHAPNKRHGKQIKRVLAFCYGNRLASKVILELIDCERSLLTLLHVKKTVSERRKIRDYALINI